MPVNVFLSTTLRAYLPGYDPARGVSLSVVPGTTVSDLCRQMGIPTEKIKIVMVNGKSASFGDRLAGDERVGLFPPVGGG